MKRFIDWFLRETKVDLSDPLHNVREICKHLILLEDHLCNVEKRCPDCVLKHLLAIEALAEEAKTLDVSKKHETLLNGLSKKIEQLRDRFNNKEVDFCAMTQDVRDFRKSLMPIIVGIV